jgi:hypothetical protein
MLDILGDGNAAAIVGVLSGLLLGLASRLGRFCTLGAIEDYLYAESDLRLRMWGIAIGVAVTGSFALMGAGLLNAEETIYLGFAFAPIASIVGGLVFGYGMALAGNCGFGALARLGGGDLRNFVIVLVMGIVAYATISGPLAYLRVWAFPQNEATGTPPGIAHWLSSVMGVSPSLIGIVIGIAILLFVAAPARVRQSPSTLFWGAAFGLSAVCAWAGTQWIATNGFDGIQVASHTFSSPLGETILWTMTASGQTLSFAIGSVAGVWIGAFVGSLIKGHFRWEACEDPRELRRQIFGAGMMGFGAVVALGCSVGQGLSAFSVLAWSAPLTVAAILAGAALGLRHMIAGFQPE